MTALCSSYLFLSPNNAPSRSLRRNLQIIERGYGISLRPKAHFASIFECVVSGLNLFVAVVIAGDLVSLSLYTQFVPFPRGDLKVSSSELTATAFDYVVEPVIVLQSVGADDVIVVRIFQPENQSSRSVNVSRNGLELHAEI